MYTFFTFTPFSHKVSPIRNKSFIKIKGPKTDHSLHFHFSLFFTFHFTHNQLGRRSAAKIKRGSYLQGWCPPASLSSIKRGLDQCSANHVIRRSAKKIGNQKNRRFARILRSADSHSLRIFANLRSARFALSANLAELKFAKIRNDCKSADLKIRKKCGSANFKIHKIRWSCESCGT